MNSGWSDPKNPSWFSTSGITYRTKEEAEEINHNHKKHHKNCHIKYRVVKTTVTKEFL
jgi:hypothetical protein